MKKAQVLFLSSLICATAGAQVVFPGVFRDKVGYSFTTNIFRRSNIRSLRKCRWLTDTTKVLSTLEVGGACWTGSPDVTCPDP